MELSLLIYWIIIQLQICEAVEDEGTADADFVVRHCWVSLLNTMPGQVLLSGIAGYFYMIPRQERYFLWYTWIICLTPWQDRYCCLVYLDTFTYYRERTGSVVWYCWVSLHITMPGHVLSSCIPGYLYLTPCQDMYCCLVYLGIFT